MSIQPAGVIPEFTLNDRLRKAREYAGLEQQELADRMGASRGTVSNYERGAKRYSPMTVRMWALATGVDRTWLETGKASDPEGPEAKLRAREDSNSQPSDLELHRRLRHQLASPTAA